MGNIVYNVWIDCTEDNYWETDHDIYYIKEYNSFGTKDTCPYGWNVLCQVGAKIMHVKVPDEEDS